ncbi:MAG TPA: hypothetical protein VEK08_08610 [Planctomycetota bacterium]|nr:hypothetical protein [Planctomycetota bacterium]
MGNSEENKLESEISEQFDMLATGQFPKLNDEAVSDTRPSTPREQELQASVAELQTRLSLTEESHAVAIKERDAADEARKKLERTLAEFLTRFASVRETQSAAFKELEKLEEERRGFERKMLDIQTKLAEAQDAKQMAIQERNEAVAKLSEQTRELNEAKAELGRFREMAVAALEPLGEEHNRGMKALMMDAEKVIDEAVKAREVMSAQMEAIAAMAEDLKAHINDNRKDIGQKLTMVLGGRANESGTRPSVNGAAASAARLQPPLVASA